jgi:D-alanyl-D-alanine dipeptidase
MIRVRWDRTQGRPEPIRLLNRVRERDNGEPLVDFRLAAPEIRILRDSVIPFARQSVVNMCREAAAALPEGVYLGVVDAWRPLARQQRIWDLTWARIHEAHPERDYRALRRSVCRWVAPTDQPAPPGHCTGAAVDVWLVDAANEPLDISSPYDRFQAAPTFSLGLAEEAARNRRLLYDAMMDAGFSNCRDEWWHYSYGDAGWAVRMGLDECFYGLVELPPELYAAQEAAHQEALAKRENPFRKR